ncbi:MAG: hypothetical protein AABX70_01935 [Nanoarchaeota archaeon]
MKTIRNLFREVKVEIYKVAFLYSFLNAATAFLIVRLLITRVDINSLLFPCIVGILTLVASMIHYTDKYGFKQLEEGNPQIKEMLRTASDNVDQSSNILVQALFLDLARNMRTVSTGALLAGNLFGKILIIAGVAAAPVVLDSFNMRVDGLGNLPFGQTFFNSQSQNKFTPHLKPNRTTIEELGGFNDSDLIFGDDSVAKLSNEQIDLQLTPEMKEMDFNKEKELEDKQFQRNNYPVAVSAQSAETADNDIPKESELAKAYSLQVRGS